MMHSRAALFAIPLLALGSFSAHAQGDNAADKWTLKPLVLPILPVPPNSQLNPSTLGTSQTPYTTAPLQNPAQSTRQSVPGLKLSIPTTQQQP